MRTSAAGSLRGLLVCALLLLMAPDLVTAQQCDPLGGALCVSGTAAGAPFAVAGCFTFIAPPLIAGCLGAVGLGTTAALYQCAKDICTAPGTYCCGGICAPPCTTCLPATSILPARISSACDGDACKECKSFTDVLQDPDPYPVVSYSCEPKECSSSVCSSSTGCDPTTGCTSEPIFCGDSDVCFDRYCDPSLGCAKQDLCDDGDPCTVDTCTLADGCKHKAKCDDDNLCTNDSCDPLTGLCTNESIPPPSESNKCLVCSTTCDPTLGWTGSCSLKVCWDGDPCKWGYCVTSEGCVTGNQCGVGDPKPWICLPPDTPCKCCPGTDGSYSCSYQCTP